MDPKRQKRNKYVLEDPAEVMGYPYEYAYDNPHYGSLNGSHKGTPSQPVSGDYGYGSAPSYYPTYNSAEYVYYPSFASTGTRSVSDQSNGARSGKSRRSDHSRKTSKGNRNVCIVVSVLMTLIILGAVIGVIVYLTDETPPMPDVTTTSASTTTTQTTTTEPPTTTTETPTTTSPTAGTVFNGSVKISTTWNSNLNNPSSAAFQSLASAFQNGMNNAFKNTTINGTYIGTTVTGMRSGSVLIDFIVEFLEEQLKKTQTEILSEVIVKLKEMKTTTDNALLKLTDEVSATVTVIKGATVAEPTTTQPPTTETVTTQPPTTETVTTQPTTTQTVPTQPPTTQTVPTQPPTSETVTTQPTTTQNLQTQPPTTETVTTQPPTTETVQTQPPTTEIVQTQPTTTETVSTQPPTTETVNTQPPTTKSATTQQQDVSDTTQTQTSVTSQPEATKPSGTEPSPHTTPEATTIPATPELTTIPLTTAEQTTESTTEAVTLPPVIEAQFNASLTINTTYDSALNDTNSTTYKTFEEDFTSMMDDIYKNQTNENGTYAGTKILDVLPGSIRIRFIIIWILKEQLKKVEKADVIDIFTLEAPKVVARSNNHLLKKIETQVIEVEEPVVVIIPVTRPTLPPTTKPTPAPEPISFYGRLNISDLPNIPGMEVKHSVQFNMTETLLQSTVQGFFKDHEIDKTFGYKGIRLLDLWKKTGYHVIAICISFARKEANGKTLNVDFLLRSFHQIIRAADATDSIIMQNSTVKENCVPDPTKQPPTKETVSFQISSTLNGMTWTDALLDKNSPAYLKLANDSVSVIMTAYYQLGLIATHQKTTLLTAWEGSVKLEHVSTFSTSADMTAQKLLELLKSKLSVMNAILAPGGLSISDLSVKDFNGTIPTPKPPAALSLTSTITFGGIDYSNDLKDNNSSEFRRMEDTTKKMYKVGLQYISEELANAVLNIDVTSMRNGSVTVVCKIYFSSDKVTINGKTVMLTAAFLRNNLLSVIPALNQYLKFSKEYVKSIDVLADDEDKEGGEAMFIIRSTMVGFTYMADLSNPKSLMYLGFKNNSELSVNTVLRDTPMGKMYGLIKVELVKMINDSNQVGLFIRVIFKHKFVTANGTRSVIHSELVKKTVQEMFKNPMFGKFLPEGASMSQEVTVHEPVMFEMHECLLMGYDKNYADKDSREFQEVRASALYIAKLTSGMAQFFAEHDLEEIGLESISQQPNCKGDYSMLTMKYKFNQRTTVKDGETRTLTGFYLTKWSITNLEDIIKMIQKATNSSSPVYISFVKFTETKDDGQPPKSESVIFLISAKLNGMTWTDALLDKTSQAYLALANTSVSVLMTSYYSLGLHAIHQRTIFFGARKGSVYLDILTEFKENVITLNGETESIILTPKKFLELLMSQLAAMNKILAAGSLSLSDLSVKDYNGTIPTPKPPAVSSWSSSVTFGMEWSDALLDKNSKEFKDMVNLTRSMYYYGCLHISQELAEAIQDLEIKSMRNGSVTVVVVIYFKSDKVTINGKTVMLTAAFLKNGLMSVIPALNRYIMAYKIRIISFDVVDSENKPEPEIEAVFMVRMTMMGFTFVPDLSNPGSDISRGFKSNSELSLNTLLRNTSVGLKYGYVKAELIKLFNDSNKVGLYMQVVFKHKYVKENDKRSVIYSELLKKALQEMVKNPQFSKFLPDGASISANIEVDEPVMFEMHECLLMGYDKNYADKDSRKFQEVRASALHIAKLISGMSQFFGEHDLEEIGLESITQQPNCKGDYSMLTMKYQFNQRTTVKDGETRTLTGFYLTKWAITNLEDIIKMIQKATNSSSPVYISFIKFTETTADGQPPKSESVIFLISAKLNGMTWTDALLDKTSLAYLTLANTSVSVLMTSYYSLGLHAIHQRTIFFGARKGSVYLDILTEFKEKVITLNGEKESIILTPNKFLELLMSQLAAMNKILAAGSLSLSDLSVKDYNGTIPTPKPPAVSSWSSSVTFGMEWSDALLDKNSKEFKDMVNLTRSMYYYGCLHISQELADAIQDLEVKSMRNGSVTVVVVIYFKSDKVTINGKTVMLTAAFLKNGLLSVIPALNRYIIAYKIHIISFDVVDSENKPEPEIEAVFMVRMTMVGFKFVHDLSNPDSDISRGFKSNSELSLNTFLRNTSVGLKYGYVKAELNKLVNDSNKVGLYMRVAFKDKYVKENDKRSVIYSELLKKALQEMVQNPLFSKFLPDGASISADIEVHEPVQFEMQECIAMQYLGNYANKYSEEYKAARASVLAFASLSTQMASAFFYKEHELHGIELESITQQGNCKEHFSLLTLTYYFNKKTTYKDGETKTLTGVYLTQWSVAYLEETIQFVQKASNTSGPVYINYIRFTETSKEENMEFAIVIKMTKIDYSIELQDPNSDKFNRTVTQLLTIINAWAKEKMKQYQFYLKQFGGFSKGSTICSFSIILRKSYLQNGISPMELKQDLSSYLTQHSGEVVMVTDIAGFNGKPEKTATFKIVIVTTTTFNDTYFNKYSMEYYLTNIFTNHFVRAAMAHTSLAWQYVLKGTRIREVRNTNGYLQVTAILQFDEMTYNDVRITEDKVKQAIETYMQETKIVFISHSVNEISSTSACSADPCNSRGECKEYSDLVFTCTCRDPYFGDTCQRTKDIVEFDIITTLHNLPFDSAMSIRDSPKFLEVASGSDQAFQKAFSNLGIRDHVTNNLTEIRNENSNGKQYLVLRHRLKADKREIEIQGSKTYLTADLFNLMLTGQIDHMNDVIKHYNISIGAIAVYNSRPQRNPADAYDLWVVLKLDHHTYSEDLQDEESGSWTRITKMLKDHITEFGLDQLVEYGITFNGVRGYSPGSVIALINVRFYITSKMPPLALEKLKQKLSQFLSKYAITVLLVKDGSELRNTNNRIEFEVSVYTQVPFDKADKEEIRDTANTVKGILYHSSMAWKHFLNNTKVVEVKNNNGKLQALISVDFVMKAHGNTTLTAASIQEALDEISKEYNLNISYTVTEFTATPEPFNVLCAMKTTDYKYRSELMDPQKDDGKKLINEIMNSTKEWLSKVHPRHHLVDIKIDGFGEGLEFAVKLFFKYQKANNNDLLTSDKVKEAIENLLKSHSTMTVMFCQDWIGAMQGRVSYLTTVTNSKMTYIPSMIARRSLVFNETKKIAAMMTKACLYNAKMAMKHNFRGAILLKIRKTTDNVEMTVWVGFGRRQSIDSSSITGQQIHDVMTKCFQAYNNATGETLQVASNNEIDGKDACLSKPCYNGGNCSTHEDTFRCFCRSQFTGRMCEVAMGEDSARFRVSIILKTTQWSDSIKTFLGGELAKMISQVMDFSKIGPLYYFKAPPLDIEFNHEDGKVIAEVTLMFLTKEAFMPDTQSVVKITGEMIRSQLEEVFRQLNTSMHFGILEVKEDLPSTRPIAMAQAALTLEGKQFVDSMKDKSSPEFKELEEISDVIREALAKTDIGESIVYFKLESAESGSIVLIISMQITKIITVGGQTMTLTLPVLQGILYTNRQAINMALSSKGLSLKRIGIRVFTDNPQPTHDPVSFLCAATTTASNFNEDLNEPEKKNGTVQRDKLYVEYKSFILGLNKDHKLNGFEVDGFGGDDDTLGYAVMLHYSYKTSLKKAVLTSDAVFTSVEIALKEKGLNVHTSLKYCQDYPGQKNDHAYFMAIVKTALPFSRAFTIRRSMEFQDVSAASTALVKRCFWSSNLAMKHNLLKSILVQIRNDSSKSVLEVLVRFGRKTALDGSQLDVTQVTNILKECFVAGNKRDPLIQLSLQSAKESDPQLACASNPCLNNGVCSEDSATSSFVCKCHSSYDGRSCGVVKPGIPPVMFQFTFVFVGVSHATLPSLTEDQKKVMMANFGDMFKYSLAAAEFHYQEPLLDTVFVNVNSWLGVRFIAKFGLGVTWAGYTLTAMHLREEVNKALAMDKVTTVRLDTVVLYIPAPTTTAKPGDTTTAPPTAALKLVSTMRFTGIDWYPMMNDKGSAAFQGISNFTRSMYQGAFMMIGHELAKAVVGIEVDALKNGSVIAICTITFSSQSVTVNGNHVQLTPAYLKNSLLGTIPGLNMYFGTSGFAILSFDVIDSGNKSETAKEAVFVARLTMMNFTYISDLSNRRSEMYLGFKNNSELSILTLLRNSSVALTFGFVKVELKDLVNDTNRVGLVMILSFKHKFVMENEKRSVIYSELVKKALQTMIKNPYFKHFLPPGAYISSEIEVHEPVTFEMNECLGMAYLPNYANKDSKEFKELSAVSIYYASLSLDMTPLFKEHDLDKIEMKSVTQPATCSGSFAMLTLTYHFNKKTISKEGETRTLTGTHLTEWTVQNLKKIIERIQQATNSSGPVYINFLRFTEIKNAENLEFEVVIKTSQVAYNNELQDQNSDKYKSTVAYFKSIVNAWGNGNMKAYGYYFKVVIGFSKGSTILAFKFGLSKPYMQPGLSADDIENNLSSFLKNHNAEVLMVRGLTDSAVTPENPTTFSIEIISTTTFNVAYYNKSSMEYMYMKALTIYVVEGALYHTNLTWKHGFISAQVTEVGNAEGYLKVIVVVQFDRKTYKDVVLTAEKVNEALETYKMYANIHSFRQSVKDDSPKIETTGVDIIVTVSNLPYDAQMINRESANFKDVAAKSLPAIMKAYSNLGLSKYLVSTTLMEIRNDGSHLILRIRSYFNEKAVVIQGSKMDLKANILNLLFSSQIRAMNEAIKSHNITIGTVTSYDLHPARNPEDAADLWVVLKMDSNNYNIELHDENSKEWKEMTEMLQKHITDFGADQLTEYGIMFDGVKGYSPGSVVSLIKIRYYVTSKMQPLALEKLKEMLSRYLSKYGINVLLVKDGSELRNTPNRIRFQVSVSTQDEFDKADRDEILDTARTVRGILYHVGLAWRHFLNSTKLVEAKNNNGKLHALVSVDFAMKKYETKTLTAAYVQEALNNISKEFNMNVTYTVTEFTATPEPFNVLCAMKTTDYKYRAELMDPEKDDGMKLMTEIMNKIREWIYKVHPRHSLVDIKIDGFGEGLEFAVKLFFKYQKANNNDVLTSDKVKEAIENLLKSHSTMTVMFCQDWMGPTEERATYLTSVTNKMMYHSSMAARRSRLFNDTKKSAGMMAKACLYNAKLAMKHNFMGVFMLKIRNATDHVEMTFWVGFGRRQSIDNSSIAIQTLHDAMTKCFKAVNNASGENLQIASSKEVDAKDACLSQPCYNHGNCSTHGDTFKCNCRSEFTGKTCEVALCQDPVKFQVTMILKQAQWSESLKLVLGPQLVTSLSYIMDITLIAPIFYYRAVPLDFEFKKDTAVTVTFTLTFCVKEAFMPDRLSPEKLTKEMVRSQFEMAFRMYDMTSVFGIREVKDESEAPRATAVAAVTLGGKTFEEAMKDKSSTQFKNLKALGEKAVQEVVSQAGEENIIADASVTSAESGSIVLVYLFEVDIKIKVGDQSVTVTPDLLKGFLRKYREAMDMVLSTDGLNVESIDIRDFKSNQQSTDDTTTAATTKAYKTDTTTTIGIQTTYMTTPGKRPPPTTTTAP